MSELRGFLLVRGDRDKLNAWRSSEEFRHLTTSADLALDNVGIVTAFIGEELQRQLMDFQAQISEMR